MLTLESVLRDLRIDAAQVTDAQVQLHTADSYQPLNEKTALWLKHNAVFLAYPLDTEFSQQPVGYVLRNLHSGPRKSIWTDISVTPQKSPIFYGFHQNLELIWETGLVIGVEGPKDALFWTQFSLPVVAYLNAQPRRTQLEVLQRYAKTFIWVPDADIFSQAEHRSRTEFSLKMLKDLWGSNFQIFKVKMDPADSDQAEVGRLSQMVSNLRLRSELSVILEP